MNLTELTALVYSPLRDAPQEFILAAEVTGWLNEAHYDLAARLRILQKDASVTIGATGRFSLPADTLEIQAIEHPTTGLIEEVESAWVDDNEFLTGSGLMGRLWNREVELYYGDSHLTTGTVLTLKYAYRPAALVNGADNSALPLEEQYRAVNYARAQALTKENEFDKASWFMGQYEQGLPQKRTGRTLLHPSPMSLRYERTPWDKDPERAHRG